MGIETAIIAGVVAAGASAASASSQAKANKAANAANMDAQQQANYLNYKRFQESRGADGNALLPLYAPAGTEQNLLMDALKQYGVLTEKTPREELALYEQVLGKWQPAIDAGRTAVGDTLSGKTQADRLAAAGPTAAAMAALGESTAQGVADANLREQAAADAAAQAAGFSGSGSTAANNRIRTTAGAASAIAVERAKAQLAAANLYRGIVDDETARRLATAGMPMNLAGNELQLAGLPAEAVARKRAAALNALGWFRLPGSTPPQVAPVLTSPQVPNSAIALSALGQVAGGFGNLGAANHVANQWGSPSSQQQSWDGWADWNAGLNAESGIINF